jgi:hypothetical protein
MCANRARALARGRRLRTVDQVRVSPLILGLALLALAALAVVLRPLLSGGGPGGAVVLASPTLTPGALNPDVTEATIRATICVHGWTRTVRPPSSYTSALKREQLRQFRLRGPPSAYQEDHLISLELGGNPTDRRNLWPEPYPRAAQVDRVENELNAAVCSGKLTLAEAQARESTLKHEHG